MSDTPRTDKEAIGFARLLVDHGTRDSPKFDVTEIISSNFARDLERELSAANARIAELEEAARRNGIKVSAPLGSLLSPHDIIEPSQPTTLPE